MKPKYQVINSGKYLRKFLEYHTGKWIYLNERESVITTSPPSNPVFTVIKIDECDSIITKKSNLENVIKEEGIDELIKIRGIGKETVEDLKRLYKDIEDVRKALREDKVPLRNDLVKILKKNLLEDD